MDILPRNFFSNALMVLGMVWILGTHWFGLVTAVVGVTLIVLGSVLRPPG